MENPTSGIYTLENFVKNELSKPGVQIFIFGPDIEPKVAEVLNYYVDTNEIQRLQIKASQSTNPDDKKFYNDIATYGDKLVVKAGPATQATRTSLQNYLRTMIKADKQLPDELKLFIELKTKVDNCIATGQEENKYNELLPKFTNVRISEDKKVDYISDEDRFKELRNAGIKLKRTNVDCDNHLELELLRLSRRLNQKKRNIPFQNMNNSEQYYYHNPTV